MASRGRWKGTVSKYTQKNAIHNYFQRQSNHIRIKGKSGVNFELCFDGLVTDSTDIAFDFVNEKVNSSFESAQKPTTHSGSRPIPVVV